MPVFKSPAEQLDAIEVQSLNADEQLAFSSLQGHVNAVRPRILLLENLSMASKTAVVASDHQADVRNVTDGTPVTVWESSFESGSWLRFDFAIPCKVHRVVIDMVGASNQKKQPGWGVEVSNDRLTWHDLNVTANASRFSIDPSSRVPCQFMRLTTDRPRPMVAEVEVWGIGESE